MRLCKIERGCVKFGVVRLGCVGLGLSLMRFGLVK